MPGKANRVPLCVRKGLLLSASLAFCCLVPAIMLHSLTSRHRALYDFFGRRWLPFLVALHKLRAIPRVSHVAPLPGAKGKYKVGIAHKWEVGDFESLNLPSLEERQKEYAASVSPEEAESMAGIDRTVAFLVKISEPNDLPMIEGMHRICACDHFSRERCWIRSKLAQGRKEVSDLEFQMSLPIIAVIDQEVYPFSTYWDQGAVIWARHNKRTSLGDCGPNFDMVFFGGVREEVAEAIGIAVEILAETYIELVPHPEPSEEMKALQRVKAIRTKSE